jgi:hypothetical protein
MKDDTHYDNEEDAKNRVAKSSVKGVKVLLQNKANFTVSCQHLETLGDLKAEVWKVCKKKDLVTNINSFVFSLSPSISLFFICLTFAFSQ